MGKRSEEQIYRNKRIAMILLSFVLILMFYFFKDASFGLRTATTICFFAIFYMIDHFFDIRFKKKHYVFVMLIGVASFMLSPLYFVYPNWDKLQHFIQPILVCSIVFYMVSKLKLDLKWKITFTFFIVIALLGFFEVAEYLLDYFFDLKLQGVYIRDLHGLEKFNLITNRIDDTMIDLMFGFSGVLIYSIWTFLFSKKKNSR